MITPEWISILKEDHDRSMCEKELAYYRTYFPGRALEAREIALNALAEIERSNALLPVGNKPPYTSRQELIKLVIDHLEEAFDK